MTCTCGACPTQYEIKLVDGRMVYFRYRLGYLSIRISPTETEDIHDAISGEEVFGEGIGSAFDGVLDLQEVRDNLLKAGFIFDKTDKKFDDFYY